MPVHAGDRPGPGNAMLYTAFAYPRGREIFKFFISVALVQTISFGSQEKQRRIWDRIRFFFVPVRSLVPSLECKQEEEFHFHLAASKLSR